MTDPTNPDHARTDVPALLAALAEARKDVERLREVERHRDLLLNGFFASCPDNHQHGVWCGSAWVAVTKRADTAEAELAEARAQVERVRALAVDNPPCKDARYDCRCFYVHPATVLAALDPADTANERGEA